MSLWLLGNLAHSGIVTSQSYVEIMAELLASLSESTFLFGLVPLSLLLSGLLHVLFQGHVHGKIFF